MKILFLDSLRGYRLLFVFSVEFRGRQKISELA